MNELFVFAAHNTLAALVLAGFVYGLSRVWRHPPVVHVLWLLVLLKLVAPPVLRIDWPALPPPGPAHASGPILADATPIEIRPDAGASPFVDRSIVPSSEPALDAGKSRAGKSEFDAAACLRLVWVTAEPICLGFWLGGTALCAVTAVIRIIRFERLLCDTLPASGRLQRITREVAGRLGVPMPDLRVVEGARVPFLWCAGRRPTIVLPMRLFCQLDGPLDNERAALILAHELAHLRRRDHWVRVVELIIASIYWWNPLVWVIRRQMHQAEDLCCDAWVRWLFPDCTQRYAEVVFETAESLTASQVSARLLPASPFLRSLSLKERIEMILESRFAPSVSTRSMFAVALLAVLVWPAFVQSTTRTALAGSSDETPAAPARNAQTAVAAGLGHTVRFEQGATRFANGDEITITEINGTDDAFAPGHFYRIKGTYTLASRDRAILLASVTVTDLATILSSGLDLTVRADHVTPGTATGAVPGQATGAEFKVQRTTVSRGTGEFTLFLPMSHKGMPHVSFYSFENGEGFGGNYFGTGDSVLKEWWGTKVKEQTATSPRAGADAPSTVTRSRKPEALATFDFPHIVPFEQGATHFANGDKITISEVRGTADKFAPGHVYWIKGTCTLASCERATLAAYVTATDARDGTGTPLKIQTTAIDRGEGTFTLILPMSCRGCPHVSLYPAEGGAGFGDNYFGTGESVLKKWWGEK